MTRHGYDCPCGQCDAHRANEAALWADVEAWAEEFARELAEINRKPVVTEDGVFMVSMEVAA